MSPSVEPNKTREPSEQVLVLSGENVDLFYDDTYKRFSIVNRVPEYQTFTWRDLVDVLSRACLAEGIEPLKDARKNLFEVESPSFSKWLVPVGTRPTATQAQQRLELSKDVEVPSTQAFPVSFDDIVVSQEPDGYAIPDALSPLQLTRLAAFVLSHPQLTGPRDASPNQYGPFLAKFVSIEREDPHIVRASDLPRIREQFRSAAREHGFDIHL